MKNAFLTGKTVYLRCIEREDIIADYLRWANDEEVTHYMVLGLKPTNKEMMETEYEKMIADDTQITFAIVDKKTNKHIGNTGLYSISWIPRSAEVRIIIGEKSFWGKGAGTEAISLLIEYGFEKLNLEKLWLGVTDKNERAVKTYLKTGFVKEGFLRHTWFRNNEYYNDIRMGILKEEYLKLKKK
ncbi:MAG: GNAT family protein [Candidatus Parcubacteria bacterium]|nr:GNAT family protein [Candidatus Parcubacteria bacterium]